MVDQGDGTLRLVGYGDVRALLSTRDQELGAALERIRALEALREPISQERPQTGPSDTTAVEPPETLSTPPKAAPWWQFWRRAPA